MVLKPSIARKLVLIPNILVLSALSACGTVPYDTASLVPPAKRCMTSPASLPKLKVGDDLVQSYASVTRSYGRETSKTRCLQRWVRTVINK